jgi:hypothetical protein
MSSILTFLLNLFNRIETSKVAELGYKSALETAKFLAYKTIIVFLVVTGSIIVTSLILEFVFTEVYDYIGSQITSLNYDTNLSFSLSMSSYFAYFVDVLRIDDAIRIILSALVVKFTLKFIPFTRF